MKPTGNRYVIGITARKRERKIVCQFIGTDLRKNNNSTTGKITTFLCSVQHAPEADMEEIRNLVTGLMVLTATRYGLNTDFVKLINPTGRFVIGGPFADPGLTGRKLACDTYGGVDCIGGGALSGKDPTKVDRSGAYAARKIARDIVRAGYASRCEVQIAYAIGIAEPVSIHVDCFETEVQPIEFINQYVKDSYDLTPKARQSEK